MFGLFLLMASTACTITEKSCICTAEFASVTVTVVDSVGNPVDSLNVSIRDERGNSIEPLEKQFPFFSGVYVVIDDSYTQALTTTPIKLIFTVSDSTRSATGDIFVNTDDCNCHVNKVMGPDSLVLR